MRHRVLLAVVAAPVLGVACTQVSTDPNSVAALQFDGPPYQSIVIGDSLRDSLGTLLPLQATALNNDGNEIEGAEIVYSSPDTVLSMDGPVVFARRRNPGDSATRVFATIGSLQSAAVRLFTVHRADNIEPVVQEDTAFAASGGAGASSPDDLAFTVLGDTAANAPKRIVQGWLVSYQLRYRDSDLSPTDSSIAYSWTGTTRRILSFVDTTDGSGRVGRKVFIRSPRLPEDTIFVVATARQRKAGTAPLTATTRLLIRQGTTTSSSVP